IRVELDRSKLLKYEVPASLVAARVGASGQNVPVGKVAQGPTEMIFRTLGEYSSIEDISKTVVNFVGNDVPVTVGQLGTVVDSVEDEKSRAFVNGKPSLFLMIFRQSGANTVAVGDGIKKRLEKVNSILTTRDGHPQVELIRDRTKYIRINLEDVEETIFLGIILTIVVVFLFLGNLRSTIITGLALPNSLLGSFILMKMFGFSINVMTLLALSLAVGLLIDDAIVVRENIFRLREKGMSAIDAALMGTREVTLAVIATTMVVIAVFGPVAFLQGMVGQFFKQFGLTVCFAMAISFFDAMTIAPLLSAYFAGGRAQTEKKHGGVYRILTGFSRFQDRLEQIYGRVLEYTIRRPMVIILGAIGIFILSLVVSSFVPKTFLPPQDIGEFSVGLDLPPGTSLARMTEVTQEVDQFIRAHKEVAQSVVTVGNRDGEFNVSEFFIELVPRRERKYNTSQFKDHIREGLKKFEFANPKVKDIDDMGGGMRPFTVAIIGQDERQLETYSAKIFEKMKNHPALRDMEV
ncbi:MAG: efflux RND transporter permease subunit, partial [Bdellovibrionota bacterium]